MLRFGAVFWFGLALLITGCPAATPTGAGCETHTDCQADEQCAAGQCLRVARPMPRCMQDGDCGADEICVEGVCADALSAECVLDTECAPPSTVCIAGACVAGCGEQGSPACAAGEQCNQVTGRCAPPSGTCTFDTECAPPTSVCEQGACVASCLDPGGIGCAPGTACSPQTGRCVLLRDQCATDIECGPPAAVCDGTRCVPSCGQQHGIICQEGQVCDQVNTGRCLAGGACGTDVDCGAGEICASGKCQLACTSFSAAPCATGDVCNGSNGRCEPPPPVSCSVDVDCSPPASICDVVAGVCQAGCTVAGCTGEDVCNQVTGRCEVPAGAPLDASCTLDGDCASNVCFNFGGGAGRRCVSACGSTADCPTGFTCHPHEGSHLCVAGGLFQGSPPFSDPSGAACSEGGSCQSGLCTQGACNERCTENADCGGFGNRCTWFEISADRFEQGCVGTAGTTLDGNSCSRDSDCASGVCFEGPGANQPRCAVHCNSATDCGAGQICGVLDYSLCTSGNPSNCAAWRVQSLTVCVDENNVGAGTVGAACSAAEDCRSLLCNQSLQLCTDTCGTNADCPSGWACKPDVLTQLPGSQPLRFNVCLPQ